MNIRSLTAGAAIPAARDERARLLEQLGSLAQDGRSAFEEAGLAIQSTRLATQPLEQWLAPGPGAVAEVEELADAASRAGFDYISLGTIQAQDPGNDALSVVDMLPDLLCAAESCFGSVMVGGRRAGGVNLEAALAAARVIRALSECTANGFGNLRFSAASTLQPHVPFFPGSYYAEDEFNGGGPEFGLAIESAEQAVRAFKTAKSPEEAQSNLLAIITGEGERVAQICGRLAADHGVTFTGMDISMAPFPTADRSIAGAIEDFSGAPFGSPGTLAAATFLTGVLKEARALLPTVGYSGLMLPALEDQTLAKRCAQGLVTTDTLLMMCAVCGMGLDTVPLPGDVSEDQLAGLIADMAALAVRLDKPLTARLIPVPGKHAGDAAEWPDFPYFAKGTVMSIGPRNGAAGFMGGNWLPVYREG